MESAKFDIPLEGLLKTNTTLLNVRLDQAAINDSYTFTESINNYTFAVVRLLSNSGGLMQDGFMIPAYFIPGNKIRLSLADGTYATFDFANDGLSATLTEKTTSGNVQYRVNLQR